MCIQWSNEKAWMIENDINVNLEFATKVKEYDDLIKNLLRNDKIGYIRVLNDII